MTIKAGASAVIGDTASINGILYTVVDATTLKNRIDSSLDVTNVCVSRITDMNDMFGSESSFNQDISYWDVSNVTDMGYMFDGARSFNQDISYWDVSNVTDMRYMFYLASSFNQDLGNWNVFNVTQCEAFSEDALAWTLPKPNFTNCNP